MPHDAFGTQIKKGDKVSFVAEVVNVTEGDDGKLCNVQVKAVHAAPEGCWQGPETLSACQLEVLADEHTETTQA